ncbi:hypothetical protein HMPREF0013_01774 [Acinetobacter sp. SH024]|uniref:hypothetical protein n=1 Tax=Acinetobacter sp. SH024 TaxID=575565 RepID=UPI0001CF7D56|nr:hypothetical protein [Acinetobacter sp. SH024]EFF86441.1 hypothetical protein HMPREF0013_01774 [Acinetobacter sp. SH024]
MNNRLQVDGLALVLNSIEPHMIGETVKLEEHVGIRQSTKTGWVGDSWVVSLGEAFFYIRSDWLMPLGDDKGIELYGLREEIMTGHDKEAV